MNTYNQFIHKINITPRETRLSTAIAVQVYTTIVCQNYRLISDKTSSIQKKRNTFKNGAHFCKAKNWNGAEKGREQHHTYLLFSIKKRKSLHDHIYHPLSHKNSTLFNTDSARWSTAIPISRSDAAVAILKVEELNSAGEEWLLQ